MLRKIREAIPLLYCRRIVAYPALFLVTFACLYYLLLNHAEQRAAEQASAQDRQTAQAQQVLAAEVPQARVTARPVPEGHALVTMRIPRFGAQWRWTAVEGVAEADIAVGPGHYPGTVLPGQPGNTAFAGHRAGHGDPFIDFDRLRPGDLVHLAQGRAHWTYRITTAPVIIGVHDVWVLDDYAPAPTLTLTTCWPKYGSAKRMYVRARLVG